MRKTIYLSKKLSSIRDFENEFMVEVIRFLDGKWRQDTWYYPKNGEKEFIRLRRKEGFKIV